jgi:hypothetical protein
MLAHKGDIELDLIGWRCARQAVKAIEVSGTIIAPRTKNRDDDGD